MRPKHRTFADEWLIDQNGQQAAVRAGYSAKYARITANKILQRPEVKEYLKIQMGMRAMGKDEALELLGKTAREAKAESVRLRALENVIKVHGLAIDKHEGELTFKVIYGDKDTPKTVDGQAARDTESSSEEEGNQ